MIVVLGPAELAEALVATAPGELVVGAKDDERLGQGVVVAAEVASALPLPARACVVAAWNDPVLACEAIRAAGGSLSRARLFVVGDPPPGMESAVWNVQVGRTGAVPVRDLDELREVLEGRSDVRGVPGASSNGHGHPEGKDGSSGSGDERRAMRPGAPEAAAWRAALRAAPTGRLTKVLRRRRLTDAPLPEARLDTAIRRPLHTGCRSIAILSPKGGVGKTTLTYLLGSAIARVRRERVLVVDTNPDFGTLADLAPAIVPSTVSDLLRDLDGVEDYDDLSQYTTTTETGMQILSAPQDPVEMVRLGREGYETVSGLLHRHYDLVIYDCGTGFLDELTQFALRRVDHVVLVTTPSLVTTKIVVGAVDHLGATGFDPSRTTLAVNMVRRDDLLDRQRLRVAMTGRIGGSVEVPYDRRMQHAMDGGEFQYAALAHSTRLAVKRLAAAVVGRMPAREPAPQVEGRPEQAAAGPQLQLTPLPGWTPPTEADAAADAPAADPAGDATAAPEAAAVIPGDTPDPAPPVTEHADVTATIDAAEATAPTEPTDTTAPGEEPAQPAAAEEIDAGEETAEPVPADDPAPPVVLAPVADAAEPAGTESVVPPRAPETAGATVPDAPHRSAHREFPAWPTLPSEPDAAEGPPVSRYTFTIPHNGAPAATYASESGARVAAGARHGRRLAFDWEPDDTSGA